MRKTTAPERNTAAMCSGTQQQERQTVILTGEVGGRHDVIVEVPLDEDPGDPLTLNTLPVRQRAHHLQQSMLGVNRAQTVAAVR